MKIEIYRKYVHCKKRFAHTSTVLHLLFYVILAKYALSLVVDLILNGPGYRKQENAKIRAEILLKSQLRYRNALPVYIALKTRTVCTWCVFLFVCFERTGFTLDLNSVYYSKKQRVQVLPAKQLFQTKSYNSSKIIIKTKNSYQVGNSL